MISLNDLEKYVLLPIFSNDDLDIKNEVKISKKVLLENLQEIAKYYFNKNERREPFYYRKLDEEFKVGKR